MSDYVIVKETDGEDDPFWVAYKINFLYVWFGLLFGDKLFFTISYRGPEQCILRLKSYVNSKKKRKEVVAHIEM